MYKFAHISDLHIPAVPKTPIKDLLSKRLTGYLSWQRQRKAVHTKTVLQTLITHLQTQSPDHICVTGDVINIGLPIEFRRSLPWLDMLGPRESVSLVPGNHDAYVTDSQHLVGLTWQDWMKDDSGEAGFPYVRKRQKIAYIGISSAIPTGPFMAYGDVHGDQLEKLAKILTELDAEGCFRVIMIHHPPQLGATKKRKGLRNAAALRDVVKEHGCELILHGHLHRQIEASVEGPHGEVLVLGVGSASMNGQNRAPSAHYYTCEVEPQDNGWALGVASHHLNSETVTFETDSIRDYIIKR